MNTFVAPRRAWREPMVWLVAGLPLLGVVAGIAIVVAALRSGGADALSDGVRRSAQVQVENTAADEEALRRGLAAQLRIDAGVIEVSLRRGPGDAPALRLRLLHPGVAARDRELLLPRSGDGRWRAPAGDLAAHAWNLRLEPTGAQWRLAGRLDAGATQADLQPLWQP